MKDDEVSEYLKYPSIPPTIDGNTIVNNMPPLPRSPFDTLVDRTSKSIRAHVFRDHGSPSPRRSRTLDIPQSEIQYSWKDLIRQQQS